MTTRCLPGGTYLKNVFQASRKQTSTIRSTLPQTAACRFQFAMGRTGSKPWSAGSCVRGMVLSPNDVLLVRVWHALRYSEGRVTLSPAVSTPFGVPQGVPPKIDNGLHFLAVP